MPTAKTIVLIEDDREISSTIQNVLEGAGYDVHTAPNGIEGRRLIEDRQPDLVITDMMMPKMGGFPVLEFLNELPKRPQVIMITANEGGRHKAYAEMLGVASYLRKPFAMDVMLDAVQEALQAADTASATDAEETEDAEKKSAKSGTARLRRTRKKKT